MNIVKSRIAALSTLLLIISLAFTINFYPLSLHPNEYLLSPDGDGLKNYYVAMFQLNQEEAILNKAMYYPWGTHLIYADAVPAFVWTIKLIATIFPQVLDYKIGIFNSLIVGSYLLCAYFVFLLLEKFLLPNWINVLVSIPMVLLSPQIYRIPSHYGLAYAFIIPLWILLLYNYFQKPSTKTLIYIFSSSLLAIFIHPYHGFNGIVLFSFFFLVAVGIHYSKTKKIKEGIRLHIGPTLSILMAFVVFMTFMKLTDSEIDRVSNPYGMMEYRSKMEGLFFPLWGPVYDLIVKLVKFSVPGFEAYAYVGVPATLFYLTTLIAFILSRFKKFKTHTFPTVTFFNLNSWFTYLFISALFIYLLAMAYPMRLGMSFLMDLIPPIKQFRSLGRLSWLVHYILVLCMLAFWWQQFNVRYLKGGNKKILWSSLILLFIWYYDVYVHFGGVGKRATITANIFLKEKKFKQIPDLDYSRYQGMTVMPLYLIGTEKMGTTRHYKGMEYGMIVSYHSGLSCMDAMLTRLPIVKSQLLWSAFAHPALISSYWDSLPSEKPFLLLRDQKTKCEGDSILASLTKVHSSDSIDYYELPVPFMKSLHLRYQARANYLLKSRINTENFIHLGYESIKSEKAFTGMGALYTSDDSTILYCGRPSKTDSCKFELSTWTYLNYDKVGMQRINYVIFRNEEAIANTISIGSSYDIYNGWMRMRAVLPPLNPTDSLLVYLRYENTWIDDFELRKIDSVSHIEINKQILLNNYPGSSD